MPIKPEDAQLISSHNLHNQNCFSYLRKLKISAFILDFFPVELAENLKNLQKPETDYNPAFPYADVYTHFFQYVEENIVTIYDNERQCLQQRISLKSAQIENSSQQDYGQLNHFMKQFKQHGQEECYTATLKLSELDEFILSIYDNDNHILEKTYETIKTITHAKTPTSPDLEKAISHHVRDVGTRANKTSLSPADAGSSLGRLSAIMSNNFKPQHTTSLATIRRYHYNKNQARIEYRFGTQGQRHQGVERVSPLFERFLDVKARKTPNHHFSHVYFNNLGLDRTDAAGKQEKALTEVLHRLEENHTHLAVITLPADKGLMAEKAYQQTSKDHDYETVYNEFLHIASESNAKRSIKDFYISKPIRDYLFKNEEGVPSLAAQETILKGLLNTSFKTLGIKSGIKLSSAERQAVWFHFIKFELTNYIITTLNPDSINFSCKDAIDRGGVSSAYYNLMQSFNSPHPMSREELDAALHAAPTMVKARGMNHQKKIIWNAIDAYINSHYDSLKKQDNQAWLIEWRDFNCPHERVENLLKLRVKQGLAELNIAREEANPKQCRAIEKGIMILTLIERQSMSEVSGARLLLEATSRTLGLALNYTKDNAIRYEVLANKLSLNYPTLNVLGGLMKSLLGVLLYVPTLGQSKEWIESGWATTKGGLEASTRQDMQSEMKAQLKQWHEILAEEEQEAPHPHLESHL